MRNLLIKLVARRALASVLAANCLAAFASAEEPISFVLPAANFQPVAADAYVPMEPPPIPQDAELITPPPVPPTPPSQPTSIVSPSDNDLDASVIAEQIACEGCNGSSSGGCLPPGRQPNGQYPDDWMWGCGGWPYANGPGTCDDWKVGPIWDVTVDGIVMARDKADLYALQSAMPNRPYTLDGQDATYIDPDIYEQFDRGPGGRVFLTGLVPRNVGYQVMAGYEGIEEWNAAIVYPEQPTFPPFGPQPPSTDPTTRRNLYYRSSLHSGELNIVRTCFPALQPYCGVRYIKFDDEIWDQTVQEVTPFPVPPTVNEVDTLNAFDIENNLIGFQGGVKYDVWNWGRRFSLQGFLNSGVYYNKAKYSNLLQEAETQWTPSGVTSGFNENLTTAEESNVAYVGEASLTGVCRLNRCWACRAGYQVLYINGVHLASDAYLNSTIDTRAMIFHGWSAGIECRR